MKIERDPSTSRYRCKDAEDCPLYGKLRRGEVGHVWTSGHAPGDALEHGLPAPNGSRAAMNTELDETHDPSLQSWVESANEPATDFPIQNLPFGRFRRRDDSAWRIGVAIGDQVLDLRRARLIDNADMNRLMRLSQRAAPGGAPGAVASLARRQPARGAFRAALVPQSSVELGVPCEIGDYTDFYTSIHHATTVGRAGDGLVLQGVVWLSIEVSGFDIGISC